MKIRALTRWEEVEALVEGWAGLLARSPTTTVFLTPNWLSAWWSAYGAACRLRVLAAEEAGRVVGVAPLCARTVRIGPFRIRRLQLLGEPRSDYNDWLVEDARPEVYAALFGALQEDPGWDWLVLADVPEESPTARRWTDLARAAGLWADVRPGWVCPSAWLDGGGPARAQRIRRRWRALESLGPVRYRLASSPAEGRAWLPAFFEQHREQWKRGGSMFEDAAHRRFFEALWDGLGPTGAVEFGRLEAGTRIAAWHFGLIDRDRLLYYKPTYDPTLAAQSPGRALIAALLDRAAERGLAELDFTRGDEPYKRDYATIARRTLTLRAARGVLGRGAAMAARSLGGAA